MRILTMSTKYCLLLHELLQEIASNYKMSFCISMLKTLEHLENRLAEYFACAEHHSSSERDKTFSTISPLTS